MRDLAETDKKVERTCREAARELASTAEAIGLAALGERRHQQPAIRKAAQVEFGEHVLVPSEQRLTMPGWDGGGRLGGVDVLITDAAGDGYQALLELKWCHD